MHKAEIVIIGAGVIGASVAYHLAARGCRDVVVLERAPAPGQGSTGKATGGFRAQFASEVNIRLSLLARQKLRSFQDELGADPGYAPCGYLFLARRPADLEAMLQAQALQHSLGLSEASTVAVPEIGLLNPAVRLEGLIGGVFCPTDGFIRPLQILQGYAAKAAELGVRFEYGVHALGFRQDASERITAVRTSRGEISAGRVVNAAGAWAALLGQQAGIEVEVEPLRRQAAMTVPCDLLPPEMPMTIFAEDWFHLRVRDGRVLLCLPDVPQTDDPFDTEVQPRWLAQVRRLADERVPCLRPVPLDPKMCWAGLYEMSPDSHALLGPAPGVENLFLVNGSSGHGVMHAPALGQLAAEMLLDGAASSLDVHALRPSRFQEGQPNPVPELL